MFKYSILYQKNRNLSNHSHALSKRWLMVFNPLALRVNDLVSGKSIFILFAARHRMIVHAAIAEWTFSLSFVKQTTRYFAQRNFVLVDETIFFSSRAVIVGGDDKVAGLTTDWTCSVVMLGHSFVVGGAPWPDAVETEDVITLIEHAELFLLGKDLIEADLTFCIFLGVIVARRRLLRSILTVLVRKSAIIPIAARVRLVIDANPFLREIFRPMILKELSDPSVIFITAAPLVELTFIEVHKSTSFLCTDRSDNSDFYRNRIIT